MSWWQKIKRNSEQGIPEGLEDELKQRSNLWHRCKNFINTHWWIMYASAAFIFILFSLILGPDSLPVQMDHKKRISTLEHNLKEAQEAFQRDSIRLEGVQNSDLDELERIARERFKMRRANELIFLLEDTTGISTKQ